MIAAGESKIVEVYVIANSPKQVPPCGGCRQKLAEFADPDVVVTLSNLAGDEEKYTVICYWSIHEKSHGLSIAASELISLVKIGETLVQQN